jgi:hypothetical protein
MVQALKCGGAALGLVTQSRVMAIRYGARRLTTRAAATPRSTHQAHPSSSRRSDRVWRGAAIAEHFELGPTRPAGPTRARPAHEPYWTGMGRDLEARENFFWPEPDPKCCF